ncbi:MAG: amidohydrolase family protein [Desulfuromonadaceae bacterium]|nr:amidohydrolase family protein [Desulfuromonadaceae bacterium]MDD2854556.1 amidohydrolase family protein [Desulfuromonadaceae bacterium]
MSQDIIYSASWLLNPDASPLAGGALLVRNGVIAETGTLKTLRSRHSAAVIDYPGAAIIPGFINSHTHLELTHFPSWKNKYSAGYVPRRFTDWIMQLIKISRNLKADDYHPSIEEGIRMCLESGTTAIGEIATNPPNADIYYKSSLNGRLYFELIGRDTGLFQQKLAIATNAAVKDGATLPSGFSPHSTYTVSEDNFKLIKSVSNQYSLPLSIHLSESASESELMFDGSGDLASEFYPFVGWNQFLARPARCSSTELLNRNGILTPATLVVHCVHTSLADARILKETGAHIALCPRSNHILDVGSPPVRLFKKLGIPLSLGTDSLASNNSLSLWDEIRFTLNAFPDDLTEPDLFNMVTIRGAEALGITATSGSLDVGRRADFQVIGNCDSTQENVLKRVIRDGSVREVFTRGERYCGTD